MLWGSADPIHLYLNTVPDYALDDIVAKLNRQSAQNILTIDSVAEKQSENIWETVYFVESIGLICTAMMN